MLQPVALRWRAATSHTLLTHCGLGSLVLTGYADSPATSRVKYNFDPSGKYGLPACNATELETPKVPATATDQPGAPGLVEAEVYEKPAGVPALL